MSKSVFRTPVPAKGQAGWFLVSAIIMTLFLTAIGFTIASLVALQYQHTRREMFDQNAQLLAEAGIEQSVDQLNADDSFAGYTSPQTFFDNSSQGKGIFTTAVTTNADGTSKTIVAIGKLYRTSAATTPYLTRKVRVTVVGTGSSGYSVLTGPGGLILSGDAGVTNSDVYVSGTITLTGNAQIGTSSNPLNVDVGNMACPPGPSPGPTYPQVCTNGSQPISLGSTTRIYGTVCATGQTSTGPNNNIQSGNGGGGLQVGCTAPTVTQPTYDRQAQINAVTTTAAATNNTYACNGNATKSWPANLKLTGDVTIGGSCNLTINGNVYITGDLSIGNTSTIKVAASLGTTRPVIIVDGTITVSGNANMIANSSGTGIEFISFKNSTGNPAANVTGTDLKNSQSLQTITVGGNGSIPGMIFDAYWSKVTLSGNGNIGAAAGQTVELNGNGTVIFGTKLQSGSKTWTITSYQPLFQ